MNRFRKAVSVFSALVVWNSGALFFKNCGAGNMSEPVTVTDQTEMFM